MRNSCARSGTRSRQEMEQPFTQHQFQFVAVLVGLLGRLSPPGGHPSTRVSARDMPPPVGVLASPNMIHTRSAVLGRALYRIQS